MTPAPKQKSETAQARIDRWRPRALAVWTVVGVFVVCWLTIGALSFVEQALSLILVGGVVGFICSPVTNRLEDHHVGRGLAALISLVLFLVLLVGLILIVGGPLMQELLALLRETPTYVEQLQSALSDFWNTYGENADPRIQAGITTAVSTLSSMGTSMASDLGRQISSGLFNNIAAMAEDLTTLFLGLVLAYWVAKDYPLMSKELAAIVGPAHGRDVTLMLAVLSRSTGGYMYGTLITSVANGLMVAGGLALVGHPYAGLLGALTFIMHFVPVIGPALSAIVATALGLFGSPALAVVTMAIMMVAQNVADNVLSPFVMQRAVQIHPALSLVGIIVGGCLGGPMGMVIAVPLTAALRGFFVYFFETRTGRQIVSENGALFRGRTWKTADGKPLPELDALDDENFFKGSRLAVCADADVAQPAAAAAAAASDVPASAPEEEKPKA